MVKRVSRQQLTMKNVYAVIVSVLALLAIFIWIVMASMPRT
jgi:hypothetical protein